MSIYKYSEKIYISSQITIYDIEEIKKLNIQTIVCNRYDDEEINQPTFSAIKKEFGFVKNFIYQPVSSNSITDEDAVKLSNILEENPNPILLYCKTGNRCSILLKMVNEN